MNKWIAMGRLTKDPDTRFTQTAQPMAIASFSIAVGRKFARDGEPDADFFNCTAFGKQGEFVDKYLKKGTKVVITGRVQNNNYTDKNGQKVYATQILVEEIEFAESKSSTGAAANEPENASGDGFMNVPTGIGDDLPFN